MTLPNFLIIGAAKAGTSSIFNYLIQHPKVYGPAIKEPAFFAFDNELVDFKGPGDELLNQTIITDFKDYQSLFDNVTEEQAIGEASVIYLYNEQAPYRIRHYIPDTKIIVILRNPVDRAISSFGHLSRDGFEPFMSLDEALKEEDKRKRNNWQHLWHYAGMGYYYESLKRYYGQFPEENIAIYLYDEFRRDSMGVLKSMFEFLEVEESFIPEVSYKYNVSGVPRSKLLHRFLRQPSAFKHGMKKIIPEKVRDGIRILVTEKNIIPQKIDVSESTRQHLKEMYQEDILKTQSLINKDLSSWTS